MTGTDSSASFPGPAHTTVSHIDGQAVIIGDNARHQISYYGDIRGLSEDLEEAAATLYNELPALVDKTAIIAAVVSTIAGITQ